MKAYKSERNPIIDISRVPPYFEDHEVIGVFNAGVARHRGEVLLLLRVAEKPLGKEAGYAFIPYYDREKARLLQYKIDTTGEGVDLADPRCLYTPEGNYVTSFSYFRIARSRNGIDFTIESEPAVLPASRYEMYGMEDPRITRIDDKYYITYTSVGDVGITTSLIVTSDFQDYERKGVIFHPTNKDVVIFPQKIKGSYYALHRPSTEFLGEKDIWLAQSDDLCGFGNHKHMIGRRIEHWDNGHVGAGAVPFLTDGGWLEIYHGVDKDERYSLGAFLMDKDDPSHILARTDSPILTPTEPYERKGFFNDVIFSCGALCEDGLVKIYYGAADSCMAYGEVWLDEIMNGLVYS